MAFFLSFLLLYVRAGGFPSAKYLGLALLEGKRWASNRASVTAVILASERAEGLGQSLLHEGDASQGALLLPLTFFNPSALSGLVFDLS